MNCTQSQKMLDDYIDGSLSIIQYGTLHAHLNKCDECRAVFRQADDLSFSLKDMPVPPARPGYEQRVLGFLESKETYNRHRNRWFAAGFGSAIAATLAIWLNITHAPVPAPGTGNLNSIDLVVAKTRKVDLVFNLPAQLRDATLKIMLPKQVEIAGYKGKQQLQWKTSLTKGTNRLSLPLIARQANDGYLVAQLTKDGKTRTFRVQIKSLQPASSLLIQDNKVTNV